MEDVFGFADEFGPAKIIHVHEPSLGLKAVLVVDNVSRGPSIGGLRMAPDVSTVECFRLARAMTLKNAAACLPHGGGKSVLYGDPRMPRERKESLVRAFAHALRNEQDYIFGPDMGTDETCMAWVKDEIGRSVGLPAAVGGIPLDEIGATGWGLFHAAEVAVRHCDFSLEGARVAIQGFGAVGRHAARFLAAKGAILVAAADSRGTIRNPKGIDVAQLTALKAAGGTVCDYPDGERLDRDAVIDVECDIWIPAARPDVIREDNVARLRTKLVLQGANIPFTPGAEKAAARARRARRARLHRQCRRGDLRRHGVPRGDAGGGLRGHRREDPRQHRGRAGQGCGRGRSLPRQAALGLAKERVKQAMSYRRFPIL